MSWELVAPSNGAPARDWELAARVNPPASRIRKWDLTEPVIQASMNSRALTVAETLEAVQDQGRKFAPSDAEYYEPHASEDDEPVARCETCVFFLPAETGDGDRCRVVDGTIRRRGVSDFYIPAEADASESDDPPHRAGHRRGGRGRAGGEGPTRWPTSGRRGYAQRCVRPGARRARNTRPAGGAA